MVKGRTDEPMVLVYFGFIEHKPRAASVICLYPYLTKNGDNENIQPAVTHEDFFEKMK